MGGKKRFLNQHAKLGFHQYKLDYSMHKKLVPFHNPLDEQKRDLKLFKTRGVSATFLKNVFKQNSNQMWYPSHKELLEASVINHYLPINGSDNKMREY